MKMQINILRCIYTKCWSKSNSKETKIKVLDWFMEPIRWRKLHITMWSWIRYCRKSWKAHNYWNHSHQSSHINRYEWNPLYYKYHKRLEVTDFDRCQQLPLLEYEINKWFIYHKHFVLSVPLVVNIYHYNYFGSGVWSTSSGR